MFSIGEFSKITGLPVRTVRFYHEKGLLAPACVDEGSGYRFYGQAEVDKGRVIVALRAMDFSLDEITEILARHDDESDILDYLERRKSTLEDDVRRRRDVISTLDQIIRSEHDARQASSKSPFEVTEKAIEPMLAACIRMQGKYDDCGAGFAALGKAVGRFMCGKPFCLYYDGEYREDDATFETCMPIRRAVKRDGVEVRELPGGAVAALLHRGPYHSLGRSYAKIIRWMRERGGEIALPTREVYLKGPGMIFRGNPKKYLTEVQMSWTE